MCRSCVEYAASGRSTRRCTEPAGAAAAARSNHAVKKIRELEVHPSPVVDEKDVKPPLDILAVQQLVFLALEDEGEAGFYDDDDDNGRASAIEQLTEEYGSVDLAIVAIGTRIAARAEELAGVTFDEVVADYNVRLASSLEEYEVAESIYGDAVRSRTLTPELNREYGLISRAHNNIKSGNDAEVKKQMSRLRQGLIDSLAEQVPMGGTLELNAHSHSGVVESLNAGAKCYPSSWIRISNSGQEVQGLVASSNGNPHYRNNRDIKIKGGEMQRVSQIAVDSSVEGSIIDGLTRYEPDAIHEQMHRYESVVEGVMAAEKLFLDRRNTLPDGTLEPVQKIFGKTETRPDHFTERYTGRRYEDGATELMSTGMEGIFGGKYGGFIGIGGRQPDIEMRNFVLGVLVTCDGKRGDC
jgi:hypothetical protein